MTGDDAPKAKKIDSLFRSRRFWLAIGAGLVTFAKQFDVEISQETIDNIVTVIGAWILGDSFRKTE